MSSDDRSTDGVGEQVTARRRSLLKATGAGALAAAGGSGAAGARVGDADLTHVEDRYGSVAAVRAAVDDHAGDVLAALAARGHLDRTDADAFDLDGLAAGDGPGRVLSLRTDGAATAQIELVRETATHEVRLVVRPERGEAYASLDPLGDGEPLTVRDDGGDVTTAACKTESRCTCEVCDLNSCVYQERTCCTNFDDDPDYDCGAWSDEGCCGCCCCG